jgi:hypothetical protein
MTNAHGCNTVVLVITANCLKVQARGLSVVVYALIK